MAMIKTKVVVVGAGMVGSAVISSLLDSDLIAEIVVIDANQDKARGEALDASHTTSFAYSPNVNVHVGGYDECRDAQIIVMSAGPSVKPGQHVDRISLAKTNVDVTKQVMEEISKFTTDALILMISNPVDILTYVAQNHFDYPPEKIIGTGTMLDTARFRRILALQYLVDTKNVHGYILGEHGNTAMATWSLTNIAGIPAQQFNTMFGDTKLDKAAVVEEVKTIGYDILQLKGFTNFGIAASINRLVKAIVLNELSVIPVSTTLHGEYGIHNVALSIPCVITSGGIGKKLTVPLTEEEIKELRDSGKYLIDVLEQLGVRK